MSQNDGPPTLSIYRVAQDVLRGLAAGAKPQPKIPAVNETASKLTPTAATNYTEVQPEAATKNWSEHTLRNLFESLPDAVVLIDSCGTIMLVNQQTEKMFGLPREKILGRPIELLIPERFLHSQDGKPANYFAFAQSRAARPDLELVGRRSNGSEFQIEISLVSLQSEEDTFATIVIRDISKRKREEAKFRTLVENIPAVTFFAPLDESVPELYVSPQIEKLLGFTQKEWLEDPVLWYRQLHPDDRERWNKEFAPTCSSGKPFEEIYRFIAKDGRVVWVKGSANVVQDAEGVPSFLQGVAFDITKIHEVEDELREAQERLRQANAELERRVQERTEELGRSMAELQEKTEELEQFAYVASHDLREPLRSLVSYPEKLAKNYGGKIDDQADIWINKTIDAATRMRRLIEDLSLFSRAVRSDQKLQTVECAAAAGEGYSNLHAAIEECEAQVHIRDLPIVMGNRELLILLFQNLIGNAIKFRAPDRTVQVEVGASRQNRDWLFWVRDNGIGIESKYLVRIFGLGERLHSTKKYAGTGFGLAICEKIVARHGGRIWAESEPDNGTTFYFTLPSVPPS